MFLATWPSILTKLQGEIRLTLTHARPQPGNSTTACPNPSPFPGGWDNNGAQGLGPAWSGTHGATRTAGPGCSQEPTPSWGSELRREGTPPSHCSHLPAPRVTSGLQVALTRWQTSSLAHCFLLTVRVSGAPESLARLQREPLNIQVPRPSPDLLILSQEWSPGSTFFLKSPSPNQPKRRWPKDSYRTDSSFKRIQERVVVEWAVTRPICMRLGGREKFPPP